MPFASEAWNRLTGQAAHFGLQGDQTVAVAALVTLLIVLLTTRLTTGHALSVKSVSDGKTTAIPPAFGHWIPFIGRTHSMILDRDGFLHGLRDRFDGIFSFTIMGATHNFVHKPSLVSSFFNLREEETDDNWMRDRIKSEVFLMPRQDQGHHFETLVKLHEEYRHLYADPGLAELTSATMRGVQREIANFVTFNEFPADQTDWERSAGAEVVDDIDGKGTQAVEVDLMELVRIFVAKTAAPAFFGTDFVDNFPDVFRLTWIFDEAFMTLAAGLPSWFPWPPLQRGRLARRKLLDMMCELNEAIDKHMDGEDPGPRWQNLDNVSRLVKGRVVMSRERGLPLEIRASLDLSLVWALTANSNPLTMWMLYEVARDPVLVEQIREEVAPYVRAVQPANEFGPAVWVSPELEGVDVEGLMTRCPLLKAAYVETQRVYNVIWSMMYMAHDAVIEDRGGKEATTNSAAAGEEKGASKAKVKAKAKAEKRSYLLKQGSYTHLPTELHNMDPEAFPDPSEWRIERHLTEMTNERGEKVLTADLGTIRPYGGGSAMCKGRAFAAREMLIYVAAIISFYDLEPVKGGGWPTPKRKKMIGVEHPTKPLRVWVKRRKIEVKS